MHASGNTCGYQHMIVFELRQTGKNLQSWNDDKGPAERKIELEWVGGDYSPDCGAVGWSTSEPNMPQSQPSRKYPIADEQLLQSF